MASNELITQEVIKEIFKSPLEQSVEQEAVKNLKRRSKLEEKAMGYRIEEAALEAGATRREIYDSLVNDAKAGISQDEINDIYDAESGIPKLYAKILKRLEANGELGGEI